MSKFMKTIRIVFSLLIIVMVAFTYIALEGDSELGFEMKTAQGVLLDFSTKEYGFYIISVVAGILIFGAIILLISTLVIKTKMSNLTLVDDGGKVVLTDDAIEAYVERSMKNFPELKNVKLNCKILGRRSKRVVAKVKAGVSDTTDVSGLSVQIKDKLKSDIDTFIGKDISEVRVVLCSVNDKDEENATNDDSGSIRIE